ncbi:MAG: RnfABCDGE type electron transport complex subunit D [Candidatus Schekmanbacteria bacterium]|nr:RnfABCDGE type electron transport complex subunit D [Candidatus Schekmanbacteria bacterium]
MNNSKLYVSSSPHIRTEEDFQKIIIAVLSALVPACVMGVYFFGLQAALVLTVSTVSAMAAEIGFNKIMGKPVRWFAGWAAISGLLLGMTLPPTVPWWMPIIGAFVAIIVAKQIYGGLGQNLFNPALVGRIVLLLSFPVQMTTWIRPSLLLSGATDAVTTASPLGLLKVDGVAKIANISYWDCLLGNIPGSIGEVAKIALLIGGIYLIWKGYITWHIPVSFIGTVGVMSTIFWLLNPTQYAHPLYHLLTGGLFLGAFFMATDYVTSPVTHKGMIIFGIGCGILTTLIRVLGVYPEGVAFSILLMNAACPLIDRYIKPTPFGAGKAR